LQENFKGPKPKERLENSVALSLSLSLSLPFHASHFLKQIANPTQIECLVAIAGVDLRSTIARWCRTFLNSHKYIECLKVSARAIIQSTIYWRKDIAQKTFLRLKQKMAFILSAQIMLNCDTDIRQFTCGCCRSIAQTKW
jgi:hypothetical protein